MSKAWLSKFGGGGPLLHVQDQKASGTSGGSSSSGDNKRELNTVLTNQINGASLIDTDDELRLPAGTYWIEASAPAYFSSKNRVRLKNETNGVDIIYGVSEFTDNTSGEGDTISRSFLYGQFTISAENDLSIVHYISAGKSSNGLGVNTNDGNVEVYTDVQIWKVG